MDRPEIALWNTVLDTRDPRALAGFYEQLLGWVRRSDDDETWVTSAPADGDRPGLAFQLEPDHVAPVWPALAGHGQMQLHLDFYVQDMQAAGAYAISLGARLAEFQPQEDVRVYLDPDGHPFCLFES